MNEEFKNLNILCVEDDRQILDTYKELLGLMFKNTFCVDSSIKAIEIFKKENIDIVITDFNMTKMNGLELAKELRNIDSTIPIILVTAHDNTEILKQALKENITNFLLKPIDFESLINVFSNAVKGIIEKRKYVEYVDYQQSLTLQKQLTIIESDFKYQNTDFDLDITFLPKDILSGDSYIIKIFEHKSVVFIVDAMGKGIAASTTAMLSSAFIKYYCHNPIEKVLEEYKKFIQPNLLDTEIISFIYLEYDRINKKAKIASFAMPPMLIKTDKIKKIKSNNPPFTKWTNKINISEINTNKIEKALIYTDGLNESNTKEKKPYNEFLIDDFNKSKNITTFVQKIFDRIPSQEDDITILFIRRKNEIKN